MVGGLWYDKLYKNSGLLEHMASLRTTIAAIASAGVLAVGCGDSRTKPISATTLEQQLAQMQTDEGKSALLVAMAKRGLIQDPAYLKQALDTALESNRFAVEGILGSDTARSVLGDDEIVRGYGLHNDPIAAIDYLIYKQKPEEAKRKLYELLRRIDRDEAARSVGYERREQQRFFAAHIAEKLGEYDLAIDLNVRLGHAQWAVDTALRHGKIGRAVSIWRDGKQYAEALKIAKEHNQPTQELFEEGRKYYEAQLCAGCPDFWEAANVLSLTGKSSDFLDYSRLLKLHGDSSKAKQVLQNGIGEALLNRNYQAVGFFSEAMGESEIASRYFEMAGHWEQAARVERARGNNTRAQVYDMFKAQ